MGPISTSTLAVLRLPILGGCSVLTGPGSGGTNYRIVFSFLVERASSHNQNPVLTVLCFATCVTLHRHLQIDVAIAYQLYP